MPLYTFHKAENTKWRHGNFLPKHFCYSIGIRRPAGEEPSCRRKVIILEVLSGQLLHIVANPIEAKKSTCPKVKDNLNYSWVTLGLMVEGWLAKCTRKEDVNKSAFGTNHHLFVFDAFVCSLLKKFQRNDQVEAPELTL